MIPKNIKTAISASIGFFIAFFGNFFSTLGTVLGVAGKAKMLDKDGNLPGIQKPFLVDAIGTCVGACTGTTPPSLLSWSPPLAWKLAAAPDSPPSPPASCFC